MEYQDVLRSYRHLSSAELEQEVAARTARRYDTRMVGAAGCMIDAYVLRACRQILAERQEAAAPSYTVARAELVQSGTVPRPVPA